MIGWSNTKAQLFAVQYGILHTRKAGKWEVENAVQTTEASVTPDKDDVKVKSGKEIKLSDTLIKGTVKDTVVVSIYALIAAAPILKSVL